MTVDVVVVGAGPAGLSAARELRRLGVGSVLVADREAAAGGVPRHSFHTGYGLRDLHRVMSGPSYAQALTGAAVAAGAQLRAGTTVTGLDARPGGPHQVTLTSAAGIETVPAAAVLLATGCRERPRAARLVPGDRPAGVMTTGELQQRVYLGRERLAGRALVVGAEHVSFSAAVTLAHAGAEVVALVTGHERQQSYAAFRLGAALRWRIPVWTRVTVSRIVAGQGAERGRLAGVEVTRDGAARFVPCETVVFTGDWIPDHELARRAGLGLDPGTRGPAVDTALATSVPGVFAAGNLVHAAETADIAALSGRHAAQWVTAFLRGEPGAWLAVPDRVPVLTEPPLRWISPNWLSLDLAGAAAAPPLGRFVLRSAEFRRGVRLEARQDGRLLTRSRPVRLIPERPVHLGAGWLDRVDPAGGPVRVLTTSSPLPLGILRRGYSFTDSIDPPGRDAARRPVLHRVHEEPGSVHQAPDVAGDRRAQRVHPSHRECRVRRAAWPAARSSLRRRPVHLGSRLVQDGMKPGFQRAGTHSKPGFMPAAGAGRDSYALRSYVERSKTVSVTSRRQAGGLRRENDPPLLILVSLADGPKHGHALARDIEGFAGVTLGPGALYGAITRLEERGLIEPLASEDRRRPYRITATGSAELATALDDMRRIASTGTARLGRLGRVGLDPA